MRRKNNGMHNAENILFDLDGTLTDPKEGITKCISFALEQLGYKSPPLEDLKKYIGPPLLQTFQEILGKDDKHKHYTAVQLYLQRYFVEGKGLVENRIYPEILPMLSKLQSTGKKLFVATSKRQVVAEKVIQHFNMQSYFLQIYGPEMDGMRSDKGELIAYILEQENISPENAVMVGDRKHDIIGATNNGVRSIGVCWGYGSVEELESAGATAIANTPEELISLL